MATKAAGSADTRASDADRLDLVEAAADELYGLAPDAFTAQRGELAKQARASGNKGAAAEIAKLRKPTVPAWLVNLLAREESGELADLLALGEQLREAQAQLLGPRMKELSQQASVAVKGLSRRAAELGDAAGQAVTAAVDRDVEQTLRAALADPQAEAAVSSGRLTRALAYAGFGEVDVTAATATPLRPGASVTPGRASARRGDTSGSSDTSSSSGAAPAAEHVVGEEVVAEEAGPATDDAAAADAGIEIGEAAGAAEVADDHAAAEPASAAGATTSVAPTATAASRTGAGPSQRTESAGPQRAPAGRAPTQTKRSASKPAPLKPATAETATRDREAVLEARRAEDAAAQAAHEEAVRAAERATEAAQAAEALVGELQDRLAQARQDAVVAAREAATAHRAEQRAARAAREAAAALRATLAKHG
ncbi:MAG TPA: hypothetical protein VKB14_04830 [Actinomycetales bacterium]|nr:hypothetical protein [Actinomycetales bacterium]